MDTRDPYLVFRLGGELFSANVNSVLEILEVPHITKVPRSPDFMRGVINLRGSVLPVIDARTKFGMPGTEDTVDTCIIVMKVEVEGRTITMGAITDGVVEVLEIEADRIQPTPSVGSKYRTEFLQGMVKHQDSFIILLDLNKVFSAQEGSIFQDITAQA